MKASNFFILVFVFSFLFSFSQELQKNETLVKRLEGVSFSYSKLNDGSDYVFTINNTSGNAVKLVWDVKIFYTELNSEEIHKLQVVSPGDVAKVNATEGLVLQEKNQNQYSSKKRIKRMEVHNVEFTGL